MKIHFDNVNFSAATGPNVFALRLAKGIFESGNEIVERGSEADISLVFIEPSGQSLAKKIVQRLDGIWFKPDEFDVKNRNIKKMYDSADAIIWQSEFDHQMTVKWWGDRHGAVIRNGTHINKIQSISIPELIQLRDRYDTIFVCSANWHPQKRLKDNVKLFKHLQATCCPNSCLIVMGSNPDVRIADHNVFFTGSQPPEVYMQVFAIANWMIHLSWCDHSPNTVIESLSQGTPVICSEVGGTRELVGDFGVILKEGSYNFELADYDNPPNIDIFQVMSLPCKESLGSHSDIDIRNVVKQYMKVFEELQ